MEYIQETQYRESILNKIHNGEKLSKEEREWLVTHPLYNTRYNSPDYYRMDVLNLNSTSFVIIDIELEHVSYKHRIIPVISVPAQKGEIKTSFEVVDLYGNKSIGKPIKMLGVDVNINNPSSTFEIQSALSLLSVHYECECYDESLKSFIMKSSFSIRNLAMRKEIIADNKVRYYCKSPTEESFDAMIFSIKITPLSITSKS